MAQVIEFPQRSSPGSTAAPTLQQSIDQAVVACRELGAKFEGIVADLERSLNILSRAMSQSPTGTSPENARKILELKEQLARARLMLEAVRNDLAPNRAPH